MIKKNFLNIYSNIKMNLKGPSEMKRKLRNVYEFSKEIPDIIIYIIILFKNIIQTSDIKFKEKNNKTINILGNGPSAIKTYLSKRKTHEDLMCVNYFALTKEFLIFKPNYYLLIDPIYFMNLDQKNQLLIKIFNKIDWKMKLFIPSKYKKKYVPLITNKNIEFVSIRFNYLPGNNHLVYYLYSKNLATPKLQNVLIACIYALINKGYMRINLHGAEANEFKNFIINSENEAILQTEHFYGKKSINMCKNGRIRKGEFYKFLLHYVDMFKGFSQVKKYSDYMGIKVYNYTTKSFLDFFERK